MEDHQFFWYLAIVPLLGVSAQWLAWRFRLPSILLLLGFGVLLGQFANPDEILNRMAEGGSDENSLASQLLFPIVSLSVAVILFEGGLSLRFHELKSAGRGIRRLVSIGTLISWLLTTIAANWVLGLEVRMAALLGAVLVVTGPTVVAPLLRHIRPVRRVASLVKWEGIVVDPIGAVLAVVVFEAFVVHGGEGTAWELAALLAHTVTVGGLIGAGAALLLVHCVMRFWIPDFLHGVVFLAVTLGVFAASNLLQEESGLVTVTVLGIVLANQKAISVQHVVEFKEHLGVFLISCLFIILGSRLDPQSLIDLGSRGILFLAALILVVRPAAVYLATFATGLTIQERTFLAFLAPRGIVAAAVTSVFALKVATIAHETPHLAELAQQAEQLVPITFLVIVGTVAIYGLSAGPLAKWLGLSDTNPQGVLIAGAEPWIRKIAKALHQEGIQVLMVDTNYANISAARIEGIPAECASILSDHVREELDMGGIGRLLAVTANDEVNTLAVREFAHIFGRANVYQLSPADGNSGVRSVASHLRGRLLFGKDLHHDELEWRLNAGCQIKKTGLTEEFSLEDFHKRYGDSAIVLFSIGDGKQLRIPEAGEPLKPGPGELVIGLVDRESVSNNGERPETEPEDTPNN